MATGGGGGGGFNFRLARAYVELDVDPARFTAGLAAAEARLSTWAARLGARLAGLGGAGVRTPALAAAGGFGMVATAARNMALRLTAAAGAYVSLRAVLKQGAGLESTTVALRRVTGLSPVASLRLADALRRMSLELAGVPLDRIFEIAQIGARLGVAGPQLEAFTRDMARVSMVLAGIPTEEAATRIARLLAVFHQGPAAALGLASALNSLDMASTASARDILDISTRLSGPASFLGMKPQQALALATALREVGVPLETGGTAMSQVMTRMASKKDVGKFAAASGMSARAFEHLIGSDPLRAIKAFEEGLHRIEKAKGPVAAVRVLDDLHLDGQRVRGTLLQLGRAMDQLNQYEEIANREWASGSSILAGSSQVAGTLSAQLTRLGSTTQALMQDVGSALAPAFKGAVEGLRMLLEDLRTALNANRETVTRWAEFVGLALMSIADLPRSTVVVFKIIGTYFQDFGDLVANIIARTLARWTDGFLYMVDVTRVRLHNISMLFQNVFSAIRGMVVTTVGTTIAHVSALVYNALAGLRKLIGGLPFLGGVAGALPAAPMRVPRIGLGLGGFAPAALGAGMMALPKFRPGGVNIPDPPDRGPERAMLLALLGLTRRRQRDLAVAGLGLVRDRIARAIAARGEAPPPAPESPAARRRRLMERARVAARRRAFTSRLAGPPADRGAIARRPALAAILDANRRTAFRRLLAGPPRRGDGVERGRGVTFRGVGPIAPGTPGPIARRILAARARRHAGDRPRGIAAGLHALGERFRAMGNFITPEMRAEAKRKEAIREAANAHADAFVNRVLPALIPGLANALKGLGVLN